MTAAVLCVLVAGCNAVRPPSPSAQPSLFASEGFVATLRVDGDGCIDPDASPIADYTVPSGTYTVRRGAVVEVRLVETETYLTSGLPEAFPWLAPVSSDPTVVSPATACAQQGITSLPVQSTLFRAVSTGHATLKVALAPEWSTSVPGCLTLAGCLAPTPIVIDIEVTD